MSFRIMDYHWIIIIIDYDYDYKYWIRDNYWYSDTTDIITGVQNHRFFDHKFSPVLMLIIMEIQAKL